MGSQLSQTTNSRNPKPRVDLFRQLNFIVGLFVLMIPLYVLVVGWSSVRDSYYNLYDALHNPSPFISVLQNWSLVAVAVSTTAAFVFYQERHNQKESSEIKATSRRFSGAILGSFAILAISFVLQVQWQQRINHAIAIEKLLDLLQGNQNYSRWQHQYRFDRLDKTKFEDLHRELNQAYLAKLKTNSSQ